MRLIAEENLQKFIKYDVVDYLIPSATQWLPSGG